MKIFLIETVDPDGWHYQYDKTSAIVVVAKDEKSARDLAGCNSGDEGYDVWQDPEITKSTVIGTGSGPARAILREYNAG